MAMKRDEIIREYKWMKVLRAILRMVDKLPGVIMSLIIGPLYIVVGVTPMVFPTLICLLIWFISTFNIVGVIVGLLVFALLWVFYITMEDKIIEWPKLLWRRSCFLRHYKTNLSGRLLRHYEKKWGMNEEQIKDYIAKREVFEKGSISYILALLHQLSKLNVSDRDEQEIFLSERFNEDEIQQIFEMDDSDSQFEETINYWREKDLSEKKSLMELLFKFSIVEDGIHNDEWKLLMQIMTQFKFNKNYFDYFKRRYSSLRTEFDDYERKSTSSLGGYSFASLEPYYAILGLEEGASIEEIKRAYHELAMQHHPDLPKNANRIEECEAKMMEINEAYEKVRG